MLDFLSPLAERLRSEDPQLTVSVKEIDSAEAVPALEAGDIDLAFARLEGELGGTFRPLPLAQDLATRGRQTYTLTAWTGVPADDCFRNVGCDGRRVAAPIVRSIDWRTVLTHEFTYTLTGRTTGKAAHSGRPGKNAAQALQRDMTAR